MAYHAAELTQVVGIPYAWFEATPLHVGEQSGRQISIQNQLCVQKRCLLTLAPPASPAISSQVVFGGADKAASRSA